MDMKDQRFGIEIEFTGITREQAAQAASRYFGTQSIESRHYGRDAYKVLDNENRIWKFIYDSSIVAKRCRATSV